MSKRQLRHLRRGCLFADSREGRLEGRLDVPHAITVVRPILHLLVVITGIIVVIIIAVVLAFVLLLDTMEREETGTCSQTHDTRGKLALGGGGREVISARGGTTEPVGPHIPYTDLILTVLLVLLLTLYHGLMLQSTQPWAATRHGTGIDCGNGLAGL